MKKLFLAICVCAGLCACSSDDDLVGSTSTGSNGEGVAFLRVNLKDVNSSTRATSDGFKSGTEAEQAVNNAYFYLYKSDGSYYAYGSVGEVTSGSTPTTTDGNIEWESTTQVAIYGLTDPSIPTQMLTVINQPSGLSLQNKSLSDAVATLAGTPWGESGNILMSTSVYSNSGIINYTALKESDFALEPINLEEDYADGGVDVYVERLAAKVSVDVSSDMSSLVNNDYVYALSAEELENFPMGAPTPSGSTQDAAIAIRLLGFDVDGIARDAYVSKHIDTDWNFTGFTWNNISYYRSYWAESPNYGVEEDYPESSNGNTAADEAGTGTKAQLNDYLRYVDLLNPVELGGATYCGENTNTVEVLDSADSNGLTNVIVKAQLVDYNPNNVSSPFTPIDIVEFHHEYYTADQFLQKCVDDVVAYDFTVLIDEVIAALKSESSATIGQYLDQLNEAIVHDHIYKSAAVENHMITSTNKPTSADEISEFGGEMLSLYNVVDGNVDIFYNMTTQPQWGTPSTSFTNIDNSLWEKYPASDIVYNKDVDLDNYEFWFHVDATKLENLAILGLEYANLLVEIDGVYYMPIDNNISFTTESGFDKNFTGSHTYTMRNFLLRAITVEADGIDTEFGTIYPNYYKDGQMYYHVPIEHLNTAPTTGLGIAEAQYGVVRNHWYDVTITSLNNLGRGIAVEDEVIVPQKEIPYYYLGADINILSWNHVTQEVGW